MENQSGFKAPGRDGQLPADANIWRKGLVYTRRSAPDEEYLAKPGYRVSAAFKCGTGGSSAGAGFRALYQRVRAVANQAIAEKTCSNAGETAGSIVLCHGWRRFGDPEISTAFLTLELLCSHLDPNEVKGETDPTEQDLRSSGGTSFEELARINPQRADEFYNEFDFSDASAWESDPVTLSYGERVSASATIDFEPFVHRAEERAERYQAFLKGMGETRSGALRIIHREWFLANDDLVTVHVCFER